MDIRDYMAGIFRLTRMEPAHCRRHDKIIRYMALYPPGLLLDWTRRETPSRLLGFVVQGAYRQQQLPVVGVHHAS